MGIVALRFPHFVGKPSFRGHRGLAVSTPSWESWRQQLIRGDGACLFKTQALECAARARTVDVTRQFDMTRRFDFRFPGPTRLGGRSPELLSRLRQLMSCSVSRGKYVAGPRPGATVDVLVPGVPRPLDAWAKALLLRPIEGEPLVLHSRSRGTVQGDSGKACRGRSSEPGMWFPGTLKGFLGRRPGEASRQGMPGKSKRARDEVPGPLPGKVPVHLGKWSDTSARPCAQGSEARCIAGDTRHGVQVGQHGARVPTNGMVIRRPVRAAVDCSTLSLTGARGVGSRSKRRGSRQPRSDRHEG